MGFEASNPPLLTAWPADCLRRVLPSCGCAKLKIALCKDWLAAVDRGGSRRWSWPLMTAWTRVLVQTVFRHPMAVRLRRQKPDLTSQVSLFRKAAMIVRPLPGLPLVGTLGSNLRVVAAHCSACLRPQEAFLRDVPRPCPQTPRTKAPPMNCQALTASKWARGLVAMLHFRRRRTITTARRRSRGNLRLTTTPIRIYRGNLLRRWMSIRACQRVGVNTCQLAKPWVQTNRPLGRDLRHRGILCRPW